MATSYPAPAEPSPPEGALRAKPLPHRAPVQQSVRHLRAPKPIYFPVEADAPEGYVHLHVRTFLFQLLGFALGDAHTVGSEQFMYWNARDSRRCLSPDVFVKLDREANPFGSWKTWEHGAPELAVEIVSPNEGDGVAWDEKLARYHELGVTELLRFDPEAPEGARVRAWDRVEGDLVEREVTLDTTPCQTLGLVWVVRPLERIRGIPTCLRLVTLDGELVRDATESEAAGRAQEAKRADAEAAAREAEAKRADDAEARIRVLEEELRRTSCS